MKVASTFGLLLTFAVPAISQKITNVTPQTVGNKVIVHYNIEDAKQQQVFEVALYSSQDEYTQALRSVSGDGVGSTVSPGKERVIIWDALNDVASLTGDVSFEVRALIKSKVIVVDKSVDISSTNASVSNKDEAYQVISSTMSDYINEAKDLKDAFQFLGVQATESREAFGKLTNALEQYNRAFEKLNKDRLTYEKYVDALWERDVLTLEFKNLMDYALGDLHSVNILTLNQKLSTINDLANSRVKKAGDVRKELAKDLQEEVPKLDKRLQELEKRTNRVLHELGSD
ncbi:MAG: hypothetical protein ABIS36_05400 [Chryseolinea sp.]